MRRPIIFFFLFLILPLVFPLQAGAGEPLTAIQTQVDSMLELLRDPAFKALATEAEKKKKMWPVIDNIFNYQELSRRTLGRSWKKLNPEQQKEFIVLFSRLLGSVYMSRLLAYTDEKVEYGQEKKLSDTRAEVQTKIVTASKEIPINYRMTSKGGKWGVYDVTVEGISLVSNYRSQFRQILSNKSPDELLAMLRKKVGKI